MVSDKLMKEYLALMSDTPLSMDDICKQLGRSESNARKVLNALLELNLVKKTNINRGGNGKKPVTVAWIKVNMVVIS
jgi:predicted transcriptional regulator